MLWWHCTNVAKLAFTLAMAQCIVFSSSQVTHLSSSSPPPPPPFAMVSMETSEISFKQYNVDVDDGDGDDGDDDPVIVPHFKTLNNESFSLKRNSMPVEKTSMVQASSSSSSSWSSRLLPDHLPHVLFAPLSLAMFGAVTIVGITLFAVLYRRELFFVAHHNSEEKTQIVTKDTTTSTNTNTGGGGNGGNRYYRRQSSIRYSIDLDRFVAEILADSDPYDSPYEENISNYYRRIHSSPKPSSSSSSEVHAGECQPQRSPPPPYLDSYSNGKVFFTPNTKRYAVSKHNAPPQLKPVAVSIINLYSQSMLGSSNQHQSVSPCHTPAQSITPPATVSNEAKFANVTTSTRSGTNFDFAHAQQQQQQNHSLPSDDEDVLFEQSITSPPYSRDNSHDLGCVPLPSVSNAVSKSPIIIELPALDQLNSSFYSCSSSLSSTSSPICMLSTPSSSKGSNESLIIVTDEANERNETTTVTTTTTPSPPASPLPPAT